MPRDKNPVGIALIGCGRVCDAHLDAVRVRPTLGRVEAVVDVDLERAKAAAARFDIPRALGSLEEALALDVVEAVDVCLPNHLHEEPTIAALSAGRHVLVEKPMADNAASAMRMGKAAELNQRVLVVGQSQRHTKAIRYVHENLHTFGHLRSVEVSYCIRWDGPQTPWWRERSRAEGLVLSLIAPHSMDFVQLVLGADDPIRVHAESVRHQSDWKGDDEAMVILTYPSGQLVSIHLTYNQRPHYDRKVLLFDDCVVQVNDDLEVRVNDHLVLRPDPGERAEMARPALQFVWQFEEFVKAIRGQQSRSVLHPDGIRLIQVIDAIKQAALAGETIDFQGPAN
jgi:predicted dehydrogenase